MNILSFLLSGNYAAFRDPSVTSNQTVYYVPSKSAVIGILGAIIGIHRSNNLGEIYSKQYLEFFRETKIGLRYETEDLKKITYFTNHRSLKEQKMKPFKTELVEAPKYRIFVQTNDKYHKQIKDVINTRNFVYSPFLGHVYCPAIIEEMKIHNGEYTSNLDEYYTSSVILDESRSAPYDSFLLNLQDSNKDERIVIERHLHHFFNAKNVLEQKVLKYWIPIQTKYTITRDPKRNLSQFVTISEEEIVCLF